MINSNLLSGTTKQDSYEIFTNEDLDKVQELKKNSHLRGQFSTHNLIFPHEDIIDRAIAIKKNNKYLGVFFKDIRVSETNGLRKDTYPDHKLYCFKPADSGIAAIAHHYKNKYDIDIYIIDNKNIINSIYEIAIQLKNGKQVGIIANLNLTNHKTPVIISKKNEEVYMITFDSVFYKYNDKSDCTFNMRQIFIHESYFNLADKLKVPCHLLFGAIARQQDSFSCISDAFIILKDALRKPNLINDLLENSKIENIANVFNKNKITTYQVHVVEFPKFLYKTVQSKSLLNKLTEKDLQITLNDTAKAKIEKKTLKTHLDKYLLSIPIKQFITISKPGSMEKKIIKKNWIMNTYLQIKAYRMLVNAFNYIDDGNGKVDTIKENELITRYINPHIALND